MKIAERVVMVLILLALLAGGFGLYASLKKEQADIRQAVADGEYEIPISDTSVELTPETTDWRLIYPNTVPMLIGSTTVNASVADSMSERIKGLSGTPFLPNNVVKLFAFGANGKHSIWMKDMNYSLDIIWVSQEGNIVHIEEDIAPETYPESFASPVPAWYVIEAAAGFVAANNITLDERVTVLQ